MKHPALALVASTVSLLGLMVGAANASASVISVSLSILAALVSIFLIWFIARL